MTNTAKTQSVETVTNNFALNVGKQVRAQGKAGAIILDQVRLLIGIDTLDATPKGFKPVEKLTINQAVIDLVTDHYDQVTSDIEESTKSQNRSHIRGILNAIKDDHRDLVEKALDGCKSPQNAYKKLRASLNDIGSGGKTEPSANQAPEATGESIDKPVSVSDDDACKQGFDCTVRGCSDDDFIVEKLYLKLSRDGGAFGVRTIAKKLELYAQKEIAKHALLNAQSKAS